MRKKDQFLAALKLKVSEKDFNLTRIGLGDLSSDSSIAVKNMSIQLLCEE